MIEQIIVAFLAIETVLFSLLILIIKAICPQDQHKRFKVQAIFQLKEWIESYSSSRIPQTKQSEYKHVTKASDIPIMENKRHLSFSYTVDEHNPGIE